MRLAARLRDDRGVSMVEAAIVLPLLVLLIFGLIEFSRGYNAQVTLTHAAREGVRTYAITQDFGQGQTAAIDAATGLDGAALSVSATACNAGDPTELTITYPFEYDIPFFGSATKTLTGKGVMRCTG